MEKLYIGVDLGSTNIKVALYNEKFKTISYYIKKALANARDE